MAPAADPQQAPPSKGRCGVSLSRLPQPHHHTLEFGARRRGQPIAAEPGLILEVQDEPFRRVGPLQHAHAAAIDAVREIDYLVGLAEGDEYLPPLRLPPRP